MPKRQRRRLSELEFDLETVRHVKRLLRRSLRALEAIERGLSRARRLEQPRPSREEVAAAVELYRGVAGQADALKRES